MAKKKHKKQGGQQFLSDENYIRQRARTLKIGTCYVSDAITKAGEGSIIVSRLHTGGRVSIGMYLVDAYCLGLKDSFCRLRIEDYELEDIVSHPNQKFRECSYEEAHNWIYGAIDWAEEAGIKPHKSWALTRYMLEEDTEDVPLLDLEFGHEGKHLLMANDQRELNYYLPLLEKNLGEGNYSWTVKYDSISDMDGDEDDDDHEEPIDADERLRPLFNEQTIRQIIEKAKNDPEFSGCSDLFKRYGPDVAYSYQHPDYPAEVSLHHPWLQEVLADSQNFHGFSEQLLGRILALPHDTLREDLEQLLYYHIGLTCDGIPEDYDADGYDGTLNHCVILLAEVGNDTSSLEAVLEVLRQNNEFYEYHLGDVGTEMLVPTLYRLGQHRLDRLAEFMREEGLLTDFKYYVMEAVAQIALHQPERRSEIIAWFADLLRFATDHLAEARSFDSTLAGFLVSRCLDLKATELLPELEALHRTGLVDLKVCGEYEKVVLELKGPFRSEHRLEFLTDIRKQYRAIFPVH